MPNANKLYWVHTKTRPTHIVERWSKFGFSMKFREERLMLLTRAGFGLNTLRLRVSLLAWMRRSGFFEMKSFLYSLNIKICLEQKMPYGMLLILWPNKVGVVMVPEYCVKLESLHFRVIGITKACFAVLVRRHQCSIGEGFLMRRSSFLSRKCFQSCGLTIILSLPLLQNTLWPVLTMNAQALVTSTLHSCMQRRPSLRHDVLDSAMWS